MNEVEETLRCINVAIKHHEKQIEELKEERDNLLKKYHIGE